MTAALLLVHGDDSLGLDEAVRAFAERIGASNQVPLRAERSPDEALLERARIESATVGLFGSPLVVLYAPLRAAGRSSAAADALVDLVASLPDGGQLALVELRPSRDIGKPPALLTRLAEAVTTAGGEVRDIRAPRKNELRGWIGQRAAARGIAIEPPALAALAERIGGIWESDVERAEDTRVADSELTKLGLSADGAPITVADVDALVADTRPASVFAVANAIDRRDAPAAAEALQRALADRQPVLVIMAALDTRIADLLAARDLIDHGAGAPELMKRLGRGNPRQAERLASAARLYTEAELVAMLRGLFEADVAIKSNTMEPEAALTAWLGEFVIGAARPRGRQA